MKTSTRRRHRLLKRIALGLAVAAIAAPSAQALPPEIAPDRNDAVVFPGSDENLETWRAYGQGLVATLPPEVRAAGTSASVVFPGNDDMEAWRAYGAALAETLPADVRGGGTPTFVVFPGSSDLEAWRAFGEVLALTLPPEVRAASASDGIVAPTQAATGSEQFDFRDALVGGAVVLGTILIAVAAAVAVRNRHRLEHLPH